MDKLQFFLPEYARLTEENGPHLRSVQYTDSAKYEWWSYMFHMYQDQMEIILILEGDCILYHNLLPYPVEAGDVLIKLPGDSFAEYLHEGGALKKVSILLGLDEPARNLLCAAPAASYVAVRQGGAYAPLLKELGIRYHALFADRQQDGCLGRQLFKTLMEIILLSEVKKPTDGGLSYDRIWSVARYMHEHFAENISLQEVSEAANLTPTYLARIFKDYTGYTINQYIMHCRIGNAEKLLMYADEYSLKEISEICGFSSVQYFYANFNRHTLATPAEYRARYLRAGDQKV